MNRRTPARDGVHVARTDMGCDAVGNDLARRLLHQSDALGVIGLGVRGLRAGRELSASRGSGSPTDSRAGLYVAPTAGCSA